MSLLHLLLLTFVTCVKWRSTAEPTITPPITTPTANASGPSGITNDTMLELYTGVIQGNGTYCGNGQSGKCSYHMAEFPPVGLSEQIHALAALNKIQFFDSKACGMCLKVTGEGVGSGRDPILGEYVVFIKDICHGGACDELGGVNLAKNGDGKWEVEIQAVQCPVGDNTLQYSFQGSNPWYIKLQVSNFRLPPNEVSIQRNGEWKTLSKTEDGYWMLSDGVEMTNTDDIPVKVTAINGEVLEDTIPQLVNGEAMDGLQGVQFSLDPELPTV